MQIPPTWTDGTDAGPAQELAIRTSPNRTDGLSVS